MCARLGGVGLSRKGRDGPIITKTKETFWY